jgi:MYXO-CTERM domain-containing protein
MRRSLPNAVAGLVAAWLLTPAVAWAGCACLDWQSLPQALNLCVKINNSTCDNTPLMAAPLDALNHWNHFLGHWTRLAPSRDVAAPRDGVHSVARLTRAQVSQRWGFAVPAQVLGVTTIPVTRPPGAPWGFCPLPPEGFYACQPAQAGGQLDVDVVAIAEQPFTVDDEEAFRTFNTPQMKYGLRQILIHEYGHAMGLQHEERSAAVMNPSYLPFRNVPMLPDDVATMRQYRPNIATAATDPLIAGFAWTPNFRYQGATLAPAQAQAGLGLVQINNFTVFHRGSQPRPAGPVRLRLDDVPVGSLACPEIPAYGGCAIVNGVGVPLPWDLSGVKTLYAEIDVLPGEPLPADNVLKLGTVTIQPAPDQDQDRDGVRPAGGDCDDLDPDRFPGNPERCDGIDQDCDRVADDGPGPGGALTQACYGGPPETRDVGLCSSGVQTCVGGRWAARCEGERRPEPAACDGWDHDCDGVPDECLEPDAAVPDMALPDAAIPDVAIPDAAIPDVAIPDVAIPDAAIPDAAIPDVAIPDVAIPDVAIPDAAIPDAAIPDALLLDAWVIDLDARGPDPDALPLPVDVGGPPLADRPLALADRGPVPGPDAAPPPPADMTLPPPVDAAVLGPADRPAMSTPDAEPPTFDAMMSGGDAASVQADGAPAQPDGAQGQADAAQAQPDGAHAQSDGAQVQADAAQAQPDAARRQVDASGAERAEPDAVPAAADPDELMARGAGCACRTGGEPVGPPATLAALVLLLGRLRRRRRGS